MVDAEFDLGWDDSDDDRAPFPLLDDVLLDVEPTTRIDAIDEFNDHNKITSSRLQKITKRIVQLAPSECNSKGEVHMLRLRKTRFNSRDRTVFDLALKLLMINPPKGWEFYRKTNPNETVSIVARILDLLTTSPNYHRKNY